MFEYYFLKLTNGLFNYKNYQSNIRFDNYFKELYQWLYLIEQNKLLHYSRIISISTIAKDEINEKGMLGKDLIMFWSEQTQ